MVSDLCTAPWRPRLHTTQKTPIGWRQLCYHTTDPKRKFLLSLQSQFCQIMFCWGRHDWRAVMLRRSVNLTPRQSKHWLALLRLAAQDTHTLVHLKLLCWASLITLYREEPRQSVPHRSLHLPTLPQTRANRESHCDFDSFNSNLYWWFLNALTSPASPSSPW